MTATDVEENTMLRIAVAGAGMIGKRHIEEVDASSAAHLSDTAGSARSWEQTSQCRVLRTPLDGAFTHSGDVVPFHSVAE